MTGVTLTLGGSAVLFGLTNSFKITAPGAHRAFPYCTSTNVFSTRSTEDTTVGSFSFSGILLGDSLLVASLVSNVFDNLGIIQVSGVTVKLETMESVPITLFHKKLLDYRIGSIDMSHTIIGNTAVASGVFSMTFRDFASPT